MRSIQNEMKILQGTLLVAFQTSDSNFQPPSDLSTHSMLVLNSIGFNILYAISTSELCSGVSYQIKLLPTQINLISCAHGLIQCSAVTAD